MKNFVLKAHNAWDKFKTGCRSAATSAKTAATTAGGAVTVWTGNAYAALPAGVESELGTVKEDVIKLGGLVLVVIIAVAAFKYMRRAV